MDNFPKLFSDEKIDELLEKARKTEQSGNKRFLSDPEQLIESMAYLSRHFPHIYQKIELLWGSTELDSWLHKAIMETKRDNGEKRRGFPPTAMGHLLKIYNIHFRAIGKKIPINIWQVKK
jgi:hypothetical protein